MFWLLLFLLILYTITYIPYKGKNFSNISWSRSAKLSIRFFLCSLLLITICYYKSFILLNLTTIITYFVTSLTWFLSPKIVRQYGKFPKFFLNDKKNSMRFIVRFEPQTMTIKYFEVLYQQSTFLFLLFVVLDTIPITSKVLFFTLAISIIHLGNFLFMHPKWVILYCLLSIPMAILFGYLILNGLVLFTASIHLAFYLIFNARYWFTKEN